MKKHLTIATCLALAAPLAALHAQVAGDTLRLVDVRAAALGRDARSAEIALLAEQSRLRLQSIDAEKFPILSTEGRAQYQSDVARVPLTLPGVKIPTPPHDTYNAQLDAQQRIYDPSLAPRRAAEVAQLAESQARVRTALYNLTETTNSAFYSALRSQEAIVQLETDVTDIAAQLQVAVARVNAGTALPSEANILRAELLRRRQLVDQQKAARRAALAVLSDLTGKNSTRRRCSLRRISMYNREIRERGRNTNSSHDREKRLSVSRMHAPRRTSRKSRHSVAWDMGGPD